MAYKKYTDESYLNTMAKLLTERCKKNQGFNLIEIASKLENIGNLWGTLITLDSPAIGIFGGGLCGGSVYVPENPLDKRSGSPGFFYWQISKGQLRQPYALVMGGEKDLEEFEKLVNNYGK